MARRKTYNKNRGRKNIRFLLAIVFIIGISTASFKMMDNAMNDEMIKIDKEISSNNKKLKEINSEIETLKSDYSIRNTDEFKEKIARQRLGMIKDNGRFERAKPHLEEGNSANLSLEEDETSEYEEIPNEDTQNFEPPEEVTNEDDTQTSDDSSEDNLEKINENDNN